MLSIDRQTKEWIVGIDSEDFPWFSRNESLRLLLDSFVVNDEEDELLSSIPHIRRKNITLVQHRSKFFSQWELSLGKSQQVLFFVVLLVPLIGLQNLSHPVVAHILRADLLRFPAHCCSSSSQTYLIHEKFWPRSESCLCLKTQFWPQLHVYRANNWLQLPTRAQFWCFLGSNLSVVMLLLFLEECIHDKPLYWNCVRDLQCLSSWNTVHSPQHSEILHPYKIYSVCLVVTAFQFVLHIVGIENFDTPGHHSPKKLMSSSHWAWLIAPSPYQVALIYREGIRILHTFPRLLRKDWAGLQKQLCEKIVSIGSRSAAKWIDSLPCPLLLSWLLDNGVVAWKIGHPLSANSNNILSAILSQIPCGLSSLIEYHFFSEPGPMNDHCPFPFFLAYKDTSRAFARRSFSLSFVHRKCRWTSTWIEFFLWNFLVFLTIRIINFWLYRWAATYWVLGRCSTRIPSALHRFCQSFCNFEKIWSTLIFAPMHR